MTVHHARIVAFAHYVKLHSGLAMIALCLVAVQCGGDDAPTAPSILSADLVFEGPLRFPNPNFCVKSCDYEGDARNLGAGCADSVRGVTTFAKSAGSKDDWTLGSRKIRPGEVFIFRGCCLGLTTTVGPETYITEIFWDNVPC